MNAHGSGKRKKWLPPKVSRDDDDDGDDGAGQGKHLRGAYGSRQVQPPLPDEPGQ